LKISAEAILSAPRCQRISIDGDKRVYVVSDLDANYTNLQDLLDRASFDPKKDRLISLGDVVDRGKDSVQLLQYFKDIGALMVLGNHEHIMLESLVCQNQEAMRIWLQNGGRWHLDETAEKLQVLCQWLLKQPLSIVLEYQSHKIGLSHTLPVDWHWDDLPDDKLELVSALLWDRERVKKRTHISNNGVDFSIHGHNSTQVPFWIANSYHIDTSYYGRPTLVELSSVVRKYDSIIKLKK